MTEMLVELAQGRMGVDWPEFEQQIGAADAQNAGGYRASNIAAKREQDHYDKSRHA